MGGLAQSLTEEATPERWDHAGVGGEALEPGEIEVHRDEGGLSAGEGVVKELEAVGDGHGYHALAAHAGELGRAEVRGHTGARLLPESPGQAGAREALLAAVGREGVEVGVGRGVVALPRSAYHAGHR